MPGFELFVAWRYLLTRKKTGFISLISMISIVGVAVGVGALIIVLSLMNGFTKELRMRLVGMDGHIWVSNALERGITDYETLAARLEKVSGVVGASPFVSYETVATSGQGGKPTAVYVRGVDSRSVNSVSDIGSYIVAGSLDFTPEEENVPGVVLGDYLALSLGHVTVGDHIVLFGEVNIEDLMTYGTLPTQMKFRVNGIFSSGYYDYDNSVILMDISQAQKMVNLPERVSGIVLKLDDMFQANRYAGSDGLISRELGELQYDSMSWIDRNQVLFKWMKLEKWAAFIVLSLIVIVAAFNIVSSQIMLVMDKTREIGILKSMGATKKSIMRIFVYQGAFVGVTGTLIGGFGGFLLTWLQDRYKIISLPADIYFISALPMDMQITDILAIAAVALLLCWFFSFYPAKRAAELVPVEAIRSE